MLKRWIEKYGGSRVFGKIPKTASTYLQRQYSPELPIVYVAVQPVTYAPDSRDEIIAVRRCGRTRGTILQYCWISQPSNVFKIDAAIANQVWDELFPTPDRIPPRRPTHFLEVGIKRPHIESRSAILSTACCFLSVARDSDYCAAEVASFLLWQFRQWTAEDFEGIKADAATPQVIWLLQCIASTWKRLRV